jgi:hypothetical protein
MVLMAVVLTTVRSVPQAQNLQQDRIAEDRHHLPVVDRSPRADEVRASRRSAGILDDLRAPRRNLRAQSATSPGILMCERGTSWDYQDNDDGQRQVATLGGNVHFIYTYWDIIPESIDRVDRFVNYNGYNPTSGLCLGDCGTTVSGAGADPYKARAGFATIDVMSDDYAVYSYHQRDEANQDPTSPQIYSSWVLDQGIPCFDLWAASQLPGSNPVEAIFPHLAVDRTGDFHTDVFHVTSHTSGDWGLENHIFYWRRTGVNGAWDGPVVVDIDGGQFNHHVAVDPSSDKVAVVYTQDNTPGNPNDLLQVVYMESATNGADWLTDGVPAFPTPLTSLGYSFTQVTNYSDPTGPQSWVECTGEYDSGGRLHVVWIEQATANVSSDCRIMHWDDVFGNATTVAEAIGWNNAGVDGARDLWLAYPQISFGDGSTSCSGESNLDYIYMTYEQYGGPTPAEANDISARGYQNLDIYLTVSTDAGLSWSPPANLTNTKTPGCDGTDGNECASERDPSLAKLVNDTLHIFYFVDADAGDAVMGQGTWTFNQALYYRIPGGTDAPYLCPEMAPVISAHLTNADPDCEYHATFGPPEIVNEQLVVENLGNDVLDVDVTVPGSPDWLDLATGPYSVPPAGPDIALSVSMDAGAPSIQSGGEGLHQATIEITHNDTSRPSPLVIPVDFFVYDHFVCPEVATLNTGCLWLGVSNTSRIADRDPDVRGLARIDPATGDSSYSIYDGSLIIGVPPNLDTLVYRDVYGTGNGQPGFRAVSPLIVDTSAYGTNTGEATAQAMLTTVDSMLTIDVD